MGKCEWCRKEKKEKKAYSGIKYYYHYTSLSAAWAMLKDDQMWASHARFSNDSAEMKNGMEIMTKLISKEYKSDKKKAPLIRFMRKLDASTIDCYIICFCKRNDVLSQWRGYCRKDGVSFGFAIGDEMTYYFKDDPLQAKKSEPLHEVYYIDSIKNKSKALDRLYNTLHEKLKENLDYECDRNEMENIIRGQIPLIKHPGFMEEDEYRLVILNSSSALPGETHYPLDPYIQCQEEKEDIKRPHLNICFGKHYDESDSCTNVPSVRLYGVPDKLEKAIRASFPKAIIEKEKNPQCPCILVGEASEMSQKETLNKLEEIKESCYGNNTNDLNELEKICIWFEGHLPIRTIMVSPCENQEEVIESFRHYCKHEKYWLKYVKVSGSSIPYRRPKK